MDAIVAVYSDWGIGKNGTQPVVISADRAHFKRVTDGRTVIVGRKTLADLPGGKPLKNRKNIVVTRRDAEIPGALIAHDRTEAFSLCGGDGLVIGGESIYRDFLPIIDRVFVTRIELCPESDRFFPDLDRDPDWFVSDPGEPMCENGINYRFAVYERIKRE